MSATGVILRIVVYRGEVVRLPAAGRTLRAVSGKAWVTHLARDIILMPGDAATLARGKDAALVSALGKAPLILELAGGPPQRPARRPSLAVPVLHSA